MDERPRWDGEEHRALQPHGSCSSVIIIVIIITTTIIIHGSTMDVSHITKSQKYNFNQILENKKKSHLEG